MISVMMNLLVKGGRLTLGVIHYIRTCAYQGF